MYFSGSPLSFAAAVLLLVQSSLACRCSGPTDTITTEFMKTTDAVGRFYIDYSFSPGTGIDGNLYYIATAYKWFKGDIGQGRLVIKTSASGSTCGASITTKTFSILFGSVSYESVPGYAGTVPTLSVHSCKPQKIASTLSKEEWNVLLNYKNHVVCAATACDTLPKPKLDPIVCPKGMESTEAAVCKGQDNGSCGWTVSGSCKASSAGTPLVCGATDCKGMIEPTLDPITCPSGTDFSKSSVCEAQSSGKCGWTVSAKCSKSPYPVTCVEKDCNGMTKPVLAALSCPTGTSNSSSFICEKQKQGGCGWTGSAECKVVSNNNGTVCVESDCSGIAKPKLDPITCPTGYSFVETSTCGIMKAVGTCGWSVSGQCQKN